MGGVYSYSQSAFLELKALVEELGLACDVEYLTDRTDVPEVLAMSDLFVLPSRFEGLGLVILEAMSSGLPVIASDTDGPSELIQDGVNGFLFKKEDSMHLFEKIQFVYQNPEKIEAICKNASQFVQAFSIQNMKTQYYELYKMLSPIELVNQSEFLNMSLPLSAERVYYESHV
jgi:glycosyltransferase involved in cell wall biosynthesis